MGQGTSQTALGAGSMNGAFFIQGDLVAEIDFSTTRAVYHQLIEGEDLDVDISTGDELSLIVELSVKMIQGGEFIPDIDFPGRMTAALNIEGVEFIEFDFDNMVARSSTGISERWEVKADDEMTLIYLAFRRVYDTGLFDNTGE